jgi:uncharacterized protein (DUF2236 family)
LATEDILAGGTPDAPEGPRVHALLGLHGPGSEMWHVNREAVLLGSGPAALLLQIAHPLVAEGVAAHSDFARDPFGRLRRTLHTTLALVFGDGVAAERAIARLNAVHGRVQGEVHDPLARQASGSSSYRALDPELLLWVQASLVVMSVRAYSSWVGPLPLDARQRLWRETRATGQRLGIPLATSPRDWLELVSWFEAQMAPGGPVVVTDTARRLAPSIVHPPVPLVPGPLMDLAVLPGLGLLPPSIRDGFGIAWGPGHAALARALGTGLRGWVRGMPRAWRALPQARAAERRVNGHTFGRPGPDAAGTRVRAAAGGTGTDSAAVARSARGWATILPPH